MVWEPPDDGAAIELDPGVRFERLIGPSALGAHEEPRLDASPPEHCICAESRHQTRPQTRHACGSSDGPDHAGNDVGAIIQSVPRRRVASTGDANQALSQDRETNHAETTCDPDEPHRGFDEKPPV